MGELIPLRERAFIPAEAVSAAFRGAPRVDRDRFRSDVDALLDQSPLPDD